MYGDIFSQYLRDPENLFVVSSDFCHWGQRFRFTYYDRSCGDIWKSIEKLDRDVCKTSLFLLFWSNKKVVRGNFSQKIITFQIQGRCC